MDTASSSSGLFQAGRILLLVGAIFSAVGAVMLIALALVFQRVGGLGSAEGAVVGIIYGVLAVFLAAGSIVGFVAFGRARRGDARGAWVLGVVSSLLPPVQGLTLVGAIFCLVSDEGKAAA